MNAMILVHGAGLVPIRPRLTWNPYFHTSLARDYHNISRWDLEVTSGVPESGDG